MWHIKGWTRAVVALFVATVVAEVGLATDMYTTDPLVFNTFRVVHCVLEKARRYNVRYVGLKEYHHGKHIHPACAELLQPLAHYPQDAGPWP